MAFGDADRDTFLADFGVDVDYGGVLVNGALPKGILKITDQGNPMPGADNSNLGRFMELVIEADLFALVPETPITVDSEIYQLVTFDKIEDGRFIRCWLQANTT